MIASTKLALGGFSPVSVVLKSSSGLAFPTMISDFNMMIKNMTEKTPIVIRTDSADILKEKVTAPSTIFIRNSSANLKNRIPKNNPTKRDTKDTITDSQKTTLPMLFLSMPSIEYSPNSLYLLLIRNEFV